MRNLMRWILWGGIMGMASPVLCASVIVTIKAQTTDVVYPPYYALYLADNTGKFFRTLHVMGQNYSYQRHMKTWFRNAIRNTEDIDALSGASLKSGATWKKSFFIDDSYIQQNYHLIIDSTSRQYGNQRREVIIKLSPKTKTTIYGKNHTDFMTVVVK